MRIELFGDKELIASAMSEETAAGLVYIINSINRESRFHSQGGSVFLDGNEDKFGHQAFIVYNQVARKKLDEYGSYFDRTEECEVVFIAESEEDRQLMLCGSGYQVNSKGQLVALFLNVSLERTIRSLAHFSQDQISNDNPGMSL